MDPESNFDVDPDIAAAMGFGGFGSQTKGKRKFDSNDGFVGKAPSATGANSMPMRDHKTVKVVQGSESFENLQRGTTLVPYDPKTQESPNLESLRYGVRNTKGDMVYFLPSFLENPWAGLRAR
ncbi:uncharacterized protein MYCFIDRAFT_77107 [Pseudocercospora fijiensis CIRAD86]|uniref:Uncharacterized protein n=1 Tax=Pseudocercospora fijiensis (strain CIRAD86) TaxID=383855 RepID=M3A987_PSEFD|nr:uncharacterized protein MYCFIDRAFT_77107 [Pseudocercospora fijiensis CIRAD86]EME81191.1 hypothetical protein MYCFIDRAFT_77107 [Pseudocercospora fijiensis CIRAD86]